MISKIGNFSIINRNNSKNNQTKRYYFNNSCTFDTVSFGNTSPILKAMFEKENNASNNVEIVSDFGIRLLKNADKLNNDTLKAEIQKFLKTNNIVNIQIKNLSEHPDKNVRTLAAGCFNPDINDDLTGLRSGVLYIGDIPKNIKNKEVATAYIAFVCHELTHAMQYAKDNSNFGFDGEINSIEEANKIFKLTNNLKPRIVPEIQQGLLMSFGKDYEKFGLSRMQLEKLIKTTNECQMPIFDKGVKISDAFILSAISPTISLAKKVDAIVEATTKGYMRYNNVSKEKETSIKKALLKRYIFEFKTEAEAYNVACEIIKKQYNIQGDCVYSMIPRAYKMIEEALIGKLSEY